ncbi:hypothetical protein C8J57DRAFT_1227114 [Mycena rebaudengoi]|nr:hypothetical protein C8J57DRAFT_1227114 [Mycena rebaudengoi]
MGADNLFGRINIVCLGDMGQLRPVKSDSLFAHNLVKHISPNVKENCKGIDGLYGAWIWRQFQKVVILRHNFRAEKDPEFTNLLARVGDGKNFKESDYKTIHSRQLQKLPKAEQKLFTESPIICGTKLVRDIINRELTRDYAVRTGHVVHDYYTQDFFNNLPLNEHLQLRTWQVRSSITKDSIGMLPLSVGMKVMVTENIALKACVVNGAEGVVREIKYSTDTRGRRYADCVRVKIQHYPSPAAFTARIRLHGLQVAGSQPRQRHSRFGRGNISAGTVRYVVES